MGLIASSSHAAAASCSYFASTAGSDGNDGSSAHPFASVSKLVATLGAGQVGCLAAGQTFNGDVNLYHSNGTASGPVTVTSTDSANPATIFGRVVTHPGADYLTFTNLKFNWNSGGQNLPSLTIGSDHLTLSYDDIQNGNTSICVDIIADATWGTAHGTTVDHSRIHNCGQRPVASYTSPGYFSHGLYISGDGTRVTNNYIYANSGKGVLLRGSSGAFVSNNVIDGNGTGVMFGDLAASNNEVTHNVITNSSAGCLCNAFGAVSWWGSTGVGTSNTFHDNCLRGNAQGDVSTSGGGFTASSNTVADPGYVDPSSGNYAVRSGSPCADDVPSGSVGPGGSGGSTVSSTTTTATTTAAQTTTSTTPTLSSTTRPSNTSVPAIEAVPVVGTYLSTTTGAWRGATPMSFTYQWQHCDSTGACTNVSGATGAYFVPARSDVGQTIRVVVTATNQAGSSSAVSGSSSPVISVPVSNTVPQIGGSPNVGATLSASTGTWDGASLNYSFNWLRCTKRASACMPIAGATGQTYQPTADDLNTRLRVMVSAQNQAGAVSATSDATSLVRR